MVWNVVTVSSVSCPKHGVGGRAGREFVGGWVGGWGGRTRRVRLRQVGVVVV